MALNPAAVRAYQSAAGHRTPRDQEADVFRHVTGGLRASKTDPGRRGAALADNCLLWLMVGDLMRDSANAMPPPLRAQIVSVGHALQREMALAEPDLDFLIAVNENIAAGLSGAR
jgi:flagellar biosynthesis regulator FlaF